jgi:hypothetical protein
MTKPDWTVFGDDLENPRTPDEIAASIANVFRTGAPSPTFLSMLAGMIDPDPAAKNSSRYEFRIMRCKSNRPAGPDWPVAFEMMRMIDVEGCSHDVAVCEIQRKFGVKGHSPAKCEAALKAARSFLELEKMVDAEIKRSSPEY